MLLRYYRVSQNQRGGIEVSSEMRARSVIKARVLGEDTDRETATFIRYGLSEGRADGQ